MQQPEPVKLAVADDVALKGEKQLEVVAAEGVVTLRRAGVLRQVVEIPRLLAVVQDDLLVKVVYVFKHVRFGSGVSGLASRVWGLASALGFGQFVGPQNLYP